MNGNRSMPAAAVMPEPACAAVGEAIGRLCGALGFTVRRRAGDHRA